ncbi:hypothetical protein C0J52_07147 [Blattella germanica]|nr:hypothetical protein C0J52_07147 [Blattella germanica]
MLHCIGKLYRLPVTVQHLQDTGIGRTVNNLRKYEGDTGEAAKALVAKWKAMVAAEESSEGEEQEETHQNSTEEEEKPQKVEEHHRSNKDRSHHEKRHKHEEKPRKSSSNNSHDQSKKRRHEEENGKKPEKRRRKQETESESSESEDNSQDQEDDSGHDSEAQSTSQTSQNMDDDEDEDSSDEEPSPPKEKIHISSKDRSSRGHTSSSSSREYKSSKDRSREHGHSKEHRSSRDSRNKEESSSSSGKDHVSTKEYGGGKDNSHRRHKDKSKDKTENKHRKDDKHREDSPKKSKSSSSSSHIPEKKHSTKIKKEKQQTEDDSIDCSTGASFAEALGMVDPILDLLSPNVKLEPLHMEVDLDATLPPITPNYKPLPHYNLYDSPPQRKVKQLTEEEALCQVMSTKNQRTKVFSGVKSKSNAVVPSLYDICVRVLNEHIDALEYTGGVPYDLLKPILQHATPEQLKTLEYYNPYLIEDTGELWKFHCQKVFRNKQRQDMETPREMFMVSFRCQDEREAKLKALTTNIQQSIAKSTPVRQTKLAYVDSYVKPPRNVARQQVKTKIHIDFT